MEINSEMLRQRMMRGALTGAPAAEESPMQYCKGKLDTGRPCRIVVFGGEEYCLRHKKEIEALIEGAPLAPGRVERLYVSPPLKKLLMTPLSSCIFASRRTGTC